MASNPAIVEIVLKVKGVCGKNVKETNHTHSMDFSGSCKGWYKVGPLLVTNGVITPISRVITPVTHL